MRSIRKLAVGLCAGSALTLGAWTAPVAAQPVVTGGLVNVTIVDFLDVNVQDVVVQIPVSAAANVCDINAAVLLAAIVDTGTASCTATSSSHANRG